MPRLTFATDSFAVEPVVVGAAVVADDVASLPHAARNAAEASPAAPVVRKRRRFHPAGTAMRIWSVMNAPGWGCGIGGGVGCRESARRVSGTGAGPSARCAGS